MQLIITFILLFIEIILFVKVVYIIGLLLSIILMIVTSCIGIFLIKRKIVKNIVLMHKKNMDYPNKKILRSISFLIAGCLLFLPGFLGDIIGLLLLFPLIQKILARKIMHYVSFIYQNTYNNSSKNMHNNSSKGKTIDGEFKRKK